MVKKILISLIALLALLSIAAQPGRSTTALKPPIEGGPTPVIFGGPNPDVTLTPAPTVVTTPDTRERGRERPGRFYWR